MFQKFSIAVNEIMELEVKYKRSNFGILFSSGIMASVTESLPSEEILDPGSAKLAF